MDNKGSFPSVKTTRPREIDPITAVISVVVPLICGRSIPPEELAYVRMRVAEIPVELLGAALEQLGDTADRSGNPIAAIRAKAAAIQKERNGLATAAKISAEIDATSAEDRARSRAFLEGLQKRLAAK